MKKTMAKYDAGTDKKLIVATVGLADPTDKENTDQIKGGVKKQLPAGVYEKATVLHLRGEIDYTRLSFKHKTMMSLLVKYSGISYTLTLEYPYFTIRDILKC